MKKKILVVSLGYPTKENPFECTFFKEQIDFLSSEYEFTIVVCKEERRGFLFDRKPTISTLEYTKGIKQYYPVIYVSAFRKCIEAVGAVICKKKRAQLTVGIYRSDAYRQYRRKCISNIIRDNNLDYDLVYCISAQGIAYDALLFSELKSKPLIVSEHRPYPHPGWSTIDAEKEAIEKAECFLAIGKDKIRQIMLQNIRPKRIAYTGNLIDETKFIISPEKHEYPTLLIVAAHAYFKNFDMFVETINKLVDKTDKEFRVIIAGYGANKGYATDTELLEQKIKNSKFPEKAELIREVSRDDICRLYNRSDAFVLTSIQEGQPMVALEAACSGLPIFSTRCGGVEDYIDDEIGRIVDITDSEALSEYLCDFIEGNIAFDGVRIRNRVIEKYGREAFMQVMKNEFDRILY